MSEVQVSTLDITALDFAPACASRRSRHKAYGTGAAEYIVRVIQFHDCMPNRILSGPSCRGCLMEALRNPGSVYCHCRETEIAPEAKSIASVTPLDPSP